MPLTNQQHLTSANLAMLERALARVNEALNFDKDSPESRHVALMMVPEFQRGTNTEDEMVKIFTGDKFPSVASPHHDERLHPRKNDFFPPVKDNSD